MATRSQFVMRTLRYAVEHLLWHAEHKQSCRRCGKYTQVDFVAPDDLYSRAMERMGLDFPESECVLCLDCYLWLTGDASGLRITAPLDRAILSNSGA